MLNWREIPFVRLLLPLILGILLAIMLDHKWYYLEHSLILLLGFLLFLSQNRKGFQLRWVYGLFLNLFLLLAGYQLSIQSNSLHSKNYFGRELQSEHTIVGTIKTIEEKGERFRLQIAVQSIGDPLKSQKESSGNLLAYFPIDSLSQQLRYGDQLLIKCSIQTIPSHQKPKAFDFQKYW